MKILLANIPWQRSGRCGVRAGSRWPHIKDTAEGPYMPFPFFLAYSAATLKKWNFEVELIDAIAERLSEDRFLTDVKNLNPDLMVVETSTVSLEDDMALIEKIDKHVSIALCGPDVNIRKEEFLIHNKRINYVLKGEYEYTLLDLARRLGKGVDLKDVSGINFRKPDGNICINPPRPLIDDLDELPWPLREGLPMEKYNDAPGDMPLPSVQMLSSRGCPYGCIFCLWPQVMYGGRNYRCRNPKDVVDEMEYLVNRLRFRSIYFDDDTFGIDRDWTSRFIQELEERPPERRIHVPWAIMTRPDVLGKKDLERMRSLGLCAVKYGIESANQELLNSSGKNLDLNKAKEMIEFTKRLGIKVHLTFMFGLPGETRRTIRDTVDFALRLKPFSVQFSIATPFPGTDYFNELDKKGFILSKKWADYDGNHRSVVKTDELDRDDLEKAIAWAYARWEWHRFFSTQIYKLKNLSVNLKFFRYLADKTRWGKFIRYAREYGLRYAVIKSIDYLYYRQIKQKIVDLMRSERDRYMIKGFKQDPRADILLVLCPPWDVTMPPLGISYLSSYLKSKGYRALIFDMNIYLFNKAKEVNKKWWHQNMYDWWVKAELFNSLFAIFRNRLDEITDNILAVDTKFIGFSVHFANRLFTIELARRIKQRDKSKIIIFGGFGCISEHMRGLVPKEAVDVFVVGEGEETLLEILSTFKKGGTLLPIEGAIINEKGILSKYIPRKPIMNLDSIPFPTYNEFYLHLFQQSALPILTSRGCIGKCTFCNDHRMSFPYRIRSAPHVLQELTFHAKHNKITNFSFKDLLCNGNVRELEQLCDLIIRSGIKISWDSQAIPKKDMTYELLAKMKKAGCQVLIYGIESFSNKVLEKMGKYFTKEGAKQVLQDTKHACIKVRVNIIIGFPGESEDEFMETYNFIKDNRRYIDRISSLNTCFVNNDTDMDCHPEIFGITLLDDPNVRAARWYDATGNTLELRKDRARRLISLLPEIGLDYECSNVSEESSITDLKTEGYDRKNGGSNRPTIF